MKTIFLFALFFASNAIAEPVFEARTETVRIVLYNEPCQLAEVSNLPLRVVWTENGKEIEGCWMAVKSMGVVMAFFASDKTVAAIPMQAFSRVIGT